MEECVFCRIAAGRIPAVKVLETQEVMAFLDIGPVSDGHTLVIPKRHCCRLDECPPQTLSELAAVLSRAAGAVQRAMKADGYNVLCNNGRAAGQIVEHLHFHIIPRKQGDGLFRNWPSFQYPPGKAEELAGQIRKELEK
jgi:histidine triad (HIT) family protein